MNIQTVANNLRNTIAGKEAYVQEIAVKAQFAEYPLDQVYDGMVMMLAVNIAELKRILKDVEQCQEVDQYQVAFDAGWAASQQY